MKRDNIKSFYIFILWVVLVSTGLVYIVSHIKLVTDLSQFIPSYLSTGDNNQNLKYLLDEVEKGDAATLLMMEISGSTSNEVAQLSRILKNKLSDLNIFTSINNGEFSGISDEIKQLFKYRYLLHTAKFDESSLNSELHLRMAEIQRGMGIALKNSLPRDPQNHFINYLQKFQQRGAPVVHHGVWFDDKEQNTILIARMKPEYNSLEDQSNILSSLREIWDGISKPENIELNISGPATFALATKNEIQNTTNKLAIVASLFMMIIFWAGYRSIRLFFVAGLPLASAVVAGLCMTNFVFGNVHGITIAFGITILGVCLDYPVHFFSHLDECQSIRKTLQTIWPTLQLGVISTVIGYLAMLNTGFTGLSQLAIFASSGLIIAVLVTRWIIPFFINDNYKVKPVLNWIPVQSGEKCTTKCRVILVLLILVMSFYVFQFSHKHRAWQQDITALSPIPKKAREFDQHLRDSLGLPDVGYIFMVRGKDPEDVLQKTESLRSDIQELTDNGIAKSIYSVTDQLPSQQSQMQLQNRLPSEVELRNSMKAALKGTPFKNSIFEPFINDVEQSKTLAPLTIEEMKQHEITASLTQDMFLRDDYWVSIIRISGVKDNEQLEQWVKQHPELIENYINIRKTSSKLVTDYRDVALQRLVMGVFLIFLTLMTFLRSFKRALKILLPVILALLLSITIEVLLGAELTIFHILAMLLVVGIGLDYSLFFQRATKNPLEQKKHFHGVIISAASTIIAFAMLALSGVPVMAAMGLTVTLGIIASFVFSWIWITPVENKGTMDQVQN